MYLFHKLALDFSMFHQKNENPNCDISHKVHSRHKSQNVLDILNSNGAIQISY